MTPQQRYRLRNLEKCRASRRASYHRHKTERVSSDEWRRNNRELVNQYARKRRLKDLGRYREAKRIFEHRRRAKFDGKHTPEDIQDIWELQNASCFYCEKPLVFIHEEEIDHFIPIRLGGSNNRWNIVLACKRCNRKKNSKAPAIFTNFRPVWPVFWDERY